MTRFDPFKGTPKFIFFNIFFPNISFFHLFGPKFAKGPHMRISQMRFEDLKVVDSHSGIVELRGKIFGNIKPKTGVIFFKILIHQ